MSGSVCFPEVTQWDWPDVKIQGLKCDKVICMRSTGFELTGNFGVLPDKIGIYQGRKVSS